MIWKKDTRRFASGEILYLGRWAVGTAEYDGCRSKSDPCKWKATCALPGMKAYLGHFDTDTGAKEATEIAVRHWLDGLSSNVESGR